jgi:predicted nucleic acid-binding protein
MTFADTSYFLALVNPGDVWHGAARRASAALAEPLLSTDWVLAELMDAMSKGRNRATVVSFVRMFVIMEDHGVRSALTTDHHFEEAGFEVLLRLEQ